MKGRLRPGGEVPKKALKTRTEPLRLSGEAVADPRLADEIARVRRVELDFPAQLRDEHPEMLGLIDGVRSPHGFQDRAVREDAVRVARQEREQLELLRREPDLVVSAQQTVPVVVDRQIADRQTAGVGALACADAP